MGIMYGVFLRVHIYGHTILAFPARTHEVCEIYGYICATAEPVFLVGAFVKTSVRLLHRPFFTYGNPYILQVFAGSSDLSVPGSLYAILALNFIIYDS